MSKITDGLPVCDRKGNPIYTDFRGALKMQEIFDDPDMSDDDKCLSMISLFYGDFTDSDGNPISLSITETVEEIYWFLNAGDIEEPSKGKAAVPKTLYDFVQDEDYIIGGFLQAYGIDLTAEDIKLHWWLFLALFKSLPEDTEMMHRIKIRSVDISKLKGPDKKAYAEMKKAVALKRKPRGNNKLGLRERLLEKQKALENTQDKP